MLAGCGGSQPPIGAPGSATELATSKKTFGYTGHKQMFLVQPPIGAPGARPYGATSGITAHSIPTAGKDA